MIPVLVVVNVPARVLVWSLHPETPGDWLLPPFAILATIASLAACRWVFHRALAELSQCEQLKGKDGTRSEG